MSRNRANTKVENNKILVEQKPKSRPLMQPEATYFQELIDVSNRYAALLKQKDGYEFASKQLAKLRARVQKDEIKMPILLPFIPKHSYYYEHDKKIVLKILDEQITSLTNSIKSLEGQLQHRYDEYAESALRNKDFVNKRYSNLAPTKIDSSRREVEGEETLFQAEFQELMESEEKKEEFRKAKMEAVKKNLARATKKTEKVK